MPWFTYTWFSIVAFEVALAYKTLNNEPWCNAQNFLAQIKKTKKQYRVFNERNIETYKDRGVLLSEAEEICKNMTMCYRCILPEPKDEEENKVLKQLADQCYAYPFPIGLGWNSLPPRLRWRSDNSQVDLFIPIDCGEGACFEMREDEWCRVECETRRSRKIICEMKPPKPGQQLPTGPPSSVPDSAAKEDVPVLTIVASVVSTLGWLLLL